MLMDRGSTSLLRVHGPLIMESLRNHFGDTKQIKICMDYCTFENIAKCDPTTTNVFFESHHNKCYAEGHLPRACYFCRFYFQLK